MNNTNPIINQLFAQFEGHSLFDKYFSFADEEEDGPYTIFHYFSELLHDLVLKKIEDEQLFTKLCTFINYVISLNDAEMDNVIKCEIFSIFNQKEYDILKKHLSDRAFNLMINIYKK